MILHRLFQFPVIINYYGLAGLFRFETSTLEGVSFPLIIPFELMAIDLMILAMFSISSVPISSLALW